MINKYDTQCDVCDGHVPNVAPINLIDLNKRGSITDIDTVLDSSQFIPRIGPTWLSVHARVLWFVFKVIDHPMQNRFVTLLYM